jgi:hypothetical protein
MATSVEFSRLPCKSSADMRFGSNEVFQLILTRARRIHGGLPERRKVMIHYDATMPAM